MKKSEILTTLIDRFFSFDSEKGNQQEYSMEEFLGYLNEKSGSHELEMREISGDNRVWFKNEYRNTTSDISILIVLMNRYAKWYMKKVLRNSQLQTPDEFSFLITLMTYDSLSKSELITKQVMEKTSGTEVIRRLLRKGLIIESADENDRRSIRVSITNSGREEILRMLPFMSQVARIVVGNLSAREINTLSYLLKKLDYFHNDIYINKRGHALSEILSET
ncbi:MAG TPA: MarR family transcriptional regulator [Bacteroidales bacterium]|nr:MarR family transcriptional regulator [Bacteroidales bacterium]HPF03341.1 MarR family transcriptional regulator [Bacteroidales bacterium]HPR13572.1 MarR family transcriptional regulator [Bacteroidales bacterium]HRW86611.1 MarR family transcriptional regulator [Bacteroidales bacterium]